MKVNGFVYRGKKVTITQVEKTGLWALKVEGPMGLAYFKSQFTAQLDAYKAAFKFLDMSDEEMKEVPHE